ncbi:MAG: hypothetical protein KDA87_20770, partial [Planctomycetales bacterium]|nr:hypothetical protein [Planctomycetales bacterium]
VAGDTPARIAITSDDHWLLSSSKSTDSDQELLQIWNLQDSESSGRMLGNVDGMVRCLSLSADTNWFAVGTTSGWLKIDSTATLQIDNQPSQTLLESVEVLAIASDSSFVVYAGEDDMQGKTNSAWFVPIGSSTATKLPCLHRDVIEAIAISPDNSLVATGGAHDDASVQICSPGSDRPAITIPAGHDSSILSLVFDNSNDWIISASPTAVFLNQVSRPDAPLQIGPTTQVKQVSLSADGEWIVLLDSTGQVQLWHLLECKMIQQACREAGVLRMRVRPVPRDIPNEI